MHILCVLYCSILQNIAKNVKLKLSIFVVGIRAHYRHGTQQQKKKKKIRNNSQFLPLPNFSLSHIDRDHRLKQY